MGSWPCVWVFTLFSNVPQPFAPSLVLMEVSAPDQTSASAPQAGEGSIATWVSRMVPPHHTHRHCAHTHIYTHMGNGGGCWDRDRSALASCPLQLSPLSGN